MLDCVNGVCDSVMLLVFSGANVWQEQLESSTKKPATLVGVCIPLAFGICHTEDLSGA